MGDLGSKRGREEPVTWQWALGVSAGAGMEGVQGSAGESLGRTRQLMPEYELLLEIKVA